MININVVLDPTRFKVDYFPPLMGKSSERYDRVCEGIAGISNILKTYYHLHLNESTDVNLESKAKGNELVINPVCLDELRVRLENACPGVTFILSKEVVEGLRADPHYEDRIV